MSAESFAIVLNHSRARGTAKLVLIGIANHQSDGGAFPKIATLARYANVHPRRVTAAIQQLVDLGELRVMYREGGTRNLPDHLRPNVYEVLLTCPEDCDGSYQHRTGKQYSRAQKGAKLPVDNSAVPSDGNSTSAENSTTPSDAAVTTPSDAAVTTKNHYLEPDLEPDQLALVSTSPETDERRVICLACGQLKPIARGRYCSSCTAAGLDSPILNCAIEGCEITGRRKFPGQQYILCPEHRHERTTADANA